MYSTTLHSNIHITHEISHDYNLQLAYFCGMIRYQLFTINISQQTENCMKLLKNANWRHKWIKMQLWKC